MLIHAFPGCNPTNLPAGRAAVGRRLQPKCQVVHGEGDHGGLQRCAVPLPVLLGGRGSACPNASFPVCSLLAGHRPESREALCSSGIWAAAPLLATALTIAPSPLGHVEQQPQAVLWGCSQKRHTLALSSLAAAPKSCLQGVLGTFQHFLLGLQPQTAHGEWWQRGHIPVLPSGVAASQTACRGYLS